jgi:hypothetical protein
MERTLGEGLVLRTTPNERWQHHSANASFRNMTPDEFDSEFLDDRQGAERSKTRVRRLRSMSPARASISADMEGATPPPAASEFSRELERLIGIAERNDRLAPQVAAIPVVGRVVGRIAGGRIIPMRSQRSLPR